MDICCRKLVQFFIFTGWLVSITPLHAQEQMPWPDTFITRLEALALIQTINAQILASPSATKTLEIWCRDHQLSEEPRISAHLIKESNKIPTNEQLRRLMVTHPNEVKYRRVQLQCGKQILSEAENWYIPARLTPEMNQLLDTTDIPFGKAVQTLEPYRRTFKVNILWSPLPDGWENNLHNLPISTNDDLVIPDSIFQHQAVIYSKDHKPFAEVSEVYQKQILAFPFLSPN